MPYSKVIIRVPDIKAPFVSGSTNYSTAYTKQANTALLKTIDNTYGRIVDYWSQQFDIPRGVIIAFIATESGGRMLAPNQYKATGLMQVTPNAVWETGRKWSTQVDVPLTAQVVSSLKSKVGNDFFTSRSSTPSSAQQSRMLVELQRDANFNIMTGAMILRWLIERFSNFATGGQLNKAMVAYNAGAYLGALNIPGTSRPNEIPIDSTSLATNRRIPTESRNYLYKMLGKDGFLSLIYKENVIKGI